MTTNVAKIHAHPLPLRSRRRTTLGKNLRKAGLPEGAFHLVKGFGSRVRITSKELSQIHHVILGITKHRQAEGSAKIVRFYSERSGSSAEENNIEGWRKGLSGHGKGGQTGGLCF